MIFNGFDKRIIIRVAGTKWIMLDKNGYRLGVGMVIRHRDGKILWCKRKGLDAWQFPQGGIEQDETHEAAMWRELQEETGLFARHVRLLRIMNQWLYYEFPETLKMSYRGQKQTWFLLELLAEDDRINLTAADEFDQWCWVDWWYPLKEVVAFKRETYRQVLEHFAASE